MPRYLALEWDSREARIAVARTRGKEAVVEHAFAVELAPPNVGETLTEAQVGERVAAALAARRIGRCETLVAVGRSNVELRRLSLPPAPPEELPDLVRFQDMRDFSGVNEDWLLDYVPLDTSSTEAAPENGGGALGVLAAVISPKGVEQIRQTCAAAGLEPEKLVLRPFAAGSLLRRARPSSECRLLVDLVRDEADLTVLIGDNVVFVRTVRLPTATDDAQTRALVAEARRTIAAAQNQLGGRRVERVVICGETSRVEAVATMVQEQLSVPVEPFDPFSVVEIDGDLKTGLPDYPGRFAPLLGMLQDEAAQVRHDIDFFNPRRRPEPPSQRRRYVLAAAVAASLVLADTFLVWQKLAADDHNIKTLQREISELNKLVDQARTLQAKAEDIHQFTRGDINWLDELKDVSRDLPPGDKILVTRLRAVSLSAGGGQFLLDGYARQASDISQMIHNLQSERREASGKGGQENRQRADYPWRFDNAVVALPPTDPEAQAGE